MALDKNDQMAGGKPASSSAAAKTGGAGSGNKSSPGGGKMGKDSSQTGGAKKGPEAGPKTSGPGGAGGVRDTGGDKRQAATSAQVGSKRDTSGTGLGGLLGGVSRPGSYAGPKGAGLLNTAARNAAIASSTPRSYAGPKGTTALNQAARFASAKTAGYPNIPGVRATAAEIDLATRVALAESSAIKNAYGKISTPAIQAVADVMRNRTLSANFPNTLGGVVTQPKQFSAMQENLNPYGPKNPDYAATRGMIESVLRGEAAPVVGNSLNYGNLDSINNPQSISKASQRSSAASRAAFNSMPVDRSFVSAANPRMQHSFGTIGQPSDVNLGAGVRPATPSLSAAVQSPAKIQDRLTPSMDMAKYNSPMAGVGGMPQARSNMNMAGYNSPMAGVGGMPRAPSNMNMAGYDSPMSGVGGMPSPKMQDRLGPEQPQQQLASQGPGLMASPNINLGRSTPNMDMAGYNSPMSGVGSLPANPQSAGMSFNPGMPRNPVSGMAFNPGMPRNQTGGMSFTPGMPGEMPQQMAQGIPGQVGREAYDPLGSIRAPVSGDAPDGSWVGTEPPEKVAEMQKHVENVLANPGLPAPGTIGPQPYMGSTYSFGVPGRPAGTRRDAIAPKGVQTAGTTALGLGLPGAGLITDGLQALGARARQGRIGNNPGGSYTEGMDHGYSYEGGSGANDGLPMWTGQEPPQMVAQMQQRVEEVLRQYLGNTAAGVV